MDKFAWERFFEDWAILIVVIFAALTPYIFAFLLYFGLVLPLRWLDRKLPDTKLKRLLFTERGQNVLSSIDNRHRARALAEYEKRSLDR